MSLREKIMKIKNKAIKAPISGSMPKLVLTYAHLPHKPIGKTIYSVLALRKNQFTDSFNLSKEKENNSMSKLKQMKFTNYNKSSLANYLENKKKLFKRNRLIKSTLFLYIFIKWWLFNEWKNKISKNDGPIS